MHDDRLTCEISYDFKLEWDTRQAALYFNRKVLMRWVAVGYGPDGLFTAATSPEFPFQPVTHPRDLQPTFEASLALRKLVDQLARAEWAEIPRGRYWFNRRFSRPLTNDGDWLSDPRCDPNEAGS